jgi:hypothetical protein
MPSYAWEVHKSESGGCSNVAPIESTTSVFISQGGFTIFNSGELPPADGERLYEMLGKIACIHNREMVVMATLPRA